MRKYIDLVDARDFRTLFIDNLGWNNPDRPDLCVEVDGAKFTLTQVAGFNGLRIWYCTNVPPRKTQRIIDDLVGKGSQERLVIFADENRQEWRWPRRAQLSGTNAKLLVHQHKIGESDTHLEKQLAAIRIGFDEDVSLVELLNRMRGAFDAETETASVQAARLMGTLYAELEVAGASAHDATLLLARLLFLLFGDDSGMWATGTFDTYLKQHTTAATLSSDLEALFDVLNTAPEARVVKAESPLHSFRYINGGLYADPLTVVSLSAEFREALLGASDYDWALISPAIFGSMFQTVKDREARRSGGEHYTTEENILKTIGPLFLDEFKTRLETSWDDRGQLTKLHNELGKLRFLDPACGCGNFLIVAYRETRALELELLKRQRILDQDKGTKSPAGRGQLSFDVTAEIKVTLDHFFGIEIEEWPARIAETAMLLVDHLANQRMEEDFGFAPDRLPIRIAPTILHGNALHADWNALVPADENVIILGNPPFIGQYTKTAQQTNDAKAIWGPRYNGYLDYVTCWYAKAIDYYGEKSGRWAFVSTNSISQGEPVEFLWRPILQAGWRCRFAHRSFQWQTEAPGGAAVHVSIIGFDKAASPKAALWTYPEGGKGSGTFREVARINPYLLDAPVVLVSNTTRPMSLSVPAVTYGSKPTDDKKLLVSKAEYEEVAADSVAETFLRRFIGAKELLHDTPRWCLWLVEATDAEVASSPVLDARVRGVKAMRQASKDKATKKAALKPTTFQYIRQPSTSYLAIPAHVGEHRPYFTAARYEAEVICGNANFMVADPDGFALGILSSSMFIAWMRGIGGRLKSDLRFSNTFTYNTFPLPVVTARQRENIVDASRGLVQARAQYPGKSLADLYDPVSIPIELVAAHDKLDAVIDKIFTSGDVSTVEARQRVLLRLYAKLTNQDTLVEV